MKRKEEITWPVESFEKCLLHLTNFVGEFGEAAIMMNLYMNEIYGNNNSY